MFENRVLKIVFGRKREEVRGRTGETTARSYAICCSPHVIRAIESMRTRRAWYDARIGGIQNAYAISVRPFEGGKSYPEHGRVQDCNVNIYCKQMGLQDVDWIKSYSD
jgi:hypothetical protein